MWMAPRHARYWEEAFNGVVMRMALLALILGAMGVKRIMLIGREFTSRLK